VSQSASQKYVYPAVIGQNCPFAISFDGTDFLVFMDENVSPTISMRAVEKPTGSVAFQVKSTTGAAVAGRLRYIAVD
jgi:hypothetical protein